MKQCILTHLRSNEDKDKFPRLLPPGTIIAHKDGSVSNARTDAGLIYTPSGVIVVCVLTDENKDQRWRSENAGNLLCAKVARRSTTTSIHPENDFIVSGQWSVVSGPFQLTTDH